MRLRRELHGLSVNATAGATARDYFSLFKLEPDFALDETALEQAYHTLLTQFHPDRYAGKPQVEQRVAAQFCADINSGYRILSDEVSRAEYLLQQAGVDLVAAERAGVESTFLMTQIGLREQLEELAAAKASLQSTVSAREADRLAEHDKAERWRLLYEASVKGWVADAEESGQPVCHQDNGKRA